jgi:NAD(P)-dependent dehydrogenase (short-subunit alcohol dehydrogenase family)
MSKLQRVALVLDSTYPVASSKYRLHDDKSLTKPNTLGIQRTELLAFQSRTPFPVAPRLITSRSWHCYNSKLGTALFFGDDIVVKSDKPE